jgi:hypothetical protein
MCSLSADNVDDNHVDKAEWLLRGTVITAVRCRRARHGLSTPGEWGGAAVPLGRWCLAFNAKHEVHVRAL